MGAYSEFMVMQQEAKLNNDYSLVDAFERNFNWRKNYSKKIYDKLSDIAISKILKSKIVISESYYQKLKTNKVLLEVFMVIKSFKNEKIKIIDLINLGFKKTSIKSAIKRLIEIKVLDGEFYKKYKLLKLKKIVLKKPKENYWILNGYDALKIFLLNGLSNAILYAINRHKSKQLNAKKLHCKINSRKVILQNAYYAKFNWSNSKIYLMNKAIANYFGVKYLQMFGILHSQEKKFITIKNEFGYLKIKFNGYKFSTQRYLLMQI
ncbi:MAGa4850 family ICE element protein [Metamycoplasma hominis]|uniref:MAGa4850 family ICE element protein n=2 Tax=Metamycoplasma hominis TaxID=2098 RepID=UPI003CEB5A16